MAVRITDNGEPIPLLVTEVNGKPESSIKAATALFAEVLEHLEADEWQIEGEWGGTAEEIAEDRERLAAYRRRWQEITGMALPEE